MQDETERPSNRAAAFLDRDGVINVDHGYTFRPDDLRFTPTAIEAIRLLNAQDYLVIVVTNQSGVARGLFGIGEVEAFHAHMQRNLQLAGARIDAFYYCPYHPDGSVPPYAQVHSDRKPSPGMLLRAIDEWSIDAARSFMIGDKESDRSAGEAAGLKTAIIPSNVGDLEMAVRALLDAADHSSSKALQID